MSGESDTPPMVWFPEDPFPVQDARRNARRREITIVAAVLFRRYIIAASSDF
jgi:hypothetical protein